MNLQYWANHMNRLVRLFDLPTETARVQRAYLHLQNKSARVQMAPNILGLGNKYSNTKVGAVVNGSRVKLTCSKGCL